MDAMKTLLISSVPLPGGVRDIVSRGSTSLEEARPGDAGAEDGARGADRVVVWAPRGDGQARDLAARLARGASPEQRAGLIVVTDDPDVPVEGLRPGEIFCWPGDEDRLTMAFMTSA